MSELLPMRVDAPVQSISVTNVSSSITLPNAANYVRLVNNGANTAFVSCGQGAQTATVPTGTASNASTPVLAGEDITLKMRYVAGSPNVLAAITASGTTTLLVQIGEGV